MLLIWWEKIKERKSIMSNKDMILTCQKCRSRFYFTVGEQNFYKQKGVFSKIDATDVVEDTFELVKAVLNKVNND